MSTFNSQINDGNLIVCSDFDTLNIEEGYSLVPVIHRSWKTSKSRLLVVIESVDSLDIRSGGLLSGETEDSGTRHGKRSNHNPMRSVFSNILDKAVSMCKPYGVDVEDKFAFGIVNFNAKKIRDQDKKDQQAFFGPFTKRVLKVIAKLKPTHILICGDTAANCLLQSLEAPEGAPRRLQPEAVSEHSEFKRGWVLNRSYKGHDFLVTPTLDIESLYNSFTKEKDTDDEDDEDETMQDKSAAADLLFFVARNVCNLFAERMLHDLSTIKPKPILIDSILKFDKMMEKLNDADTIGFDTETENLSSNHNRLVMAQFAISTEKGYVVPVDHKDTPFAKQERRYIKKRLVKLLSKKSKTFITVNGMFDLRISRATLSMPLFRGNVHEVTAGEQLLDENLGLFSRVKFYLKGDYVSTSYQNLRAMFCMYGNDYYWRAAFSKEDRVKIEQYPHDDPNVLNYCLPAGEQVQTDVGRKNIEDLKVGDKVLSYNHESGVQEFKEVENTKVHQPKKRLLKLKWSGGELTVTSDHPVWSEDRLEYVPAGELRSGERLRVEA